MDQQVRLTAKGFRWFQTGHPWVYASDLREVETDQPGIVSVVDHRGKFLAKALFSAASKIALRILTPRNDDIDRNWWKEKIKRAIVFRKQLPIDSDAMRLVNAESDFLPSLIVDRYADFLVFQTLSAGLETVKGTIIDILEEEAAPQGILEKNDPAVRGLEKLPEIVDVARGSVPETVGVREGGLKFGVNLRGGQKTGAYLDQRDNRFLAGRIASGRVVDVFSYDGWMACHTARRAESVLCVESSDEAYARIRENAQRNGLEKKITVEKGNAFDFLRERSDKREKYDRVNLDPPSFIKHPREREGGLRGYKEINLRAIKLLGEGGVLITSSCSHACDRDEFLGLVEGAAWDAHRSLQIFHSSFQPPDHPVRTVFPESLYLKTFFARVI